MATFVGKIPSTITGIGLPWPGRRMIMRPGDYAGRGKGAMNMGTIGIFGIVLRGLQTAAPLSCAARPFLAAAMAALLLLGCASKTDTHKEPPVRNRFNPIVPISDEVFTLIPNDGRWGCIPKGVEMTKRDIMKKLVKHNRRLPMTCIYEKLSAHDISKLAAQGLAAAKYLKAFQDYVPNGRKFCKSQLRSRLKMLSDAGYSHASFSSSVLAWVCGDKRLSVKLEHKALKQGADYMYLHYPGHHEGPYPPSSRGSKK